MSGIALRLLNWGARFWPCIVGVVVILGAIFYISHRSYQKGFHSRDAEVAALEKTIADVRLKTAEAQAADLARARKIETTDAAITKEENDALQTKLAAARAAAADYAARLRTAAAANQSGGGTTDLPGVANPTGLAAGTSSSTVMDEADLEACSVAVVKADGWRDWWLKVSAVER
jgi:multidrug efflux pump subunit AcrA (membrane-fusion protein)